jgi:tetratricopeptide (TPR) repeat protein
MQKNDPVAAEKDYRTLIESEHFHTIGAYTNLGSALVSQGKPREALPYLERAITLQPIQSMLEFRNAYEMLSTAQIMTGNMPAAKISLQKALKMFPGDMYLQMRLKEL